jgi:hypothetical protein
MSDRSRNRERPRAALALLLAGATLLPAATALAADPHTTEAIRQAEEARRAVQWPSPYAWGSPGPWSGWPAYPPAACTPGLPCPSAYPYPPPSVAPYPGAPVAPVMPYPAPPPPAASPYPIPANPAGRVLILVNPVDAEVYVDGVRLQQRSDLSYEVGLLAGPHRVDVKKDGYRPYSRKVDVAPGGGLYLPIGLEQ